MQSLKKQLSSAKFLHVRMWIEWVIDHTVGLFGFQYQRKDNLFNFFYNVLKEHHIVRANYFPKFTYYEFGVAGGGSMKVYLMALKKFCKDFNQDIEAFKVFGFDSFAGLPAHTEADDHGEWEEGIMKHDKSEVEGVIKGVGFPLKNVRLIPGFFEQSLTPELREELRSHPPAIVNMDADYYSSTITALDWLLQFAPSGTIFRFDDIWAFHGHKDKGVIKAIEEINSNGKYGWLTPFPILGLDGYVYIFARKEFEYTDRSVKP